MGLFTAIHCKLPLNRRKLHINSLSLHAVLLRKEHLDISGGKNREMMRHIISRINCGGIHFRELMGQSSSMSGKLKPRQGLVGTGRRVFQEESPALRWKEAWRGREWGAAWLCWGRRSETCSWGGDSGIWCKNSGAWDPQNLHLLNTNPPPPPPALALAS